MVNEKEFGEAQQRVLRACRKLGLDRVRLSLYTTQSGKVGIFVRPRRGALAIEAARSHYEALRALPAFIRRSRPHTLRHRLESARYA